MAKEVYVCNECGYKSSKWMGKCSECGAWNSFTEETVKVKGVKNITSLSAEVKITKLSEIEIPHDYRYETNFEEFDRVLGGGLLKGEVVLLSGNPGVGKSTLMLQVLEDYSRYGEIFYISGEESAEQIKHRGSRLGIKSEKLFLLSETDIKKTGDLIREKKPAIVVVDSIQTLYSSEHDGIPGTVTQIRECTLEIVNIAKSLGIAFFIVGHITKDGKIAGPKILEHMVDAVLSFEGGEDFSYRILRSVKNRYGSTNELGIFNMDETGIKEVTNPSEYFLGEREDKNIGSVVVPVMEGTRTFLLEIQSLMTNAVFGMPRRVVQGFDYNKAQIITAVIEKKLKFNLATLDLFLNIPGGIAIKEPAADLGVALSIISGVKGINIPKNLACIGEIGLMGEVRKVSFIQKRLKELEKVGFTQVFIPNGNKKEAEEIKCNMKIYYLNNLFELLERAKINEK